MPRDYEKSECHPCGYCQLPQFESDPFDGVLMIDIAEHLFDWQLDIVFKHVARLLKAGGYLYIDAPLIPLPPYSDMHVNIKEGADKYLKFLPEFRIENVVLVDPSDPII